MISDPSWKVICSMKIGKLLDTFTYKRLHMPRVKKRHRTKSTTPWSKLLDFLAFLVVLPKEAKLSDIDLNVCLLPKRFLFVN